MDAEISENRQVFTQSESGPASCPCCRDVLRAVFSNVPDPNTGELFSISRCPSCGFGQTAPEPANLAPYYRERYYGGRHWITRRYCAWRRMRVISLSSPQGAPGRLLVDIGCGDGSFLQEAQRSGWRVIGTEVSARIPAPGLEIWGTIDDLAPLAPFDCVTLWHSLEHLRDPIAGLAQLKGMLASNGTLIVAVPNARGWQARFFGHHWFHLDVPRHLHHFGVISLKAALGHAGFHVRRTWHHEVEYDVFGWIQSALNAVFAEQNVLFDWLTRRARRTGAAMFGLNVLLGAILLVPAFLLTILSTLSGSGGTIIVAASPVAADGIDAPPQPRA